MTESGRGLAVASLPLAFLVRVPARAAAPARRDRARRERPGAEPALPSLVARETPHRASRACG
ncbi:MAG: hypothetical protein RML12_09715 [Xanthomonadales bacterium]|nr:hypothetical protein [Xanthomonadales bacterium]